MDAEVCGKVWLRTGQGTENLARASESCGVWYVGSDTCHTTLGTPSLLASSACSVVSLRQVYMALKSEKATCGVGGSFGD